MQFTPAQLIKEDRPTGRVYVDSDGNEYTSVTQILKDTFVAPYALKRWLATATKEQKADAAKKRDAGSVRGASLHSNIENFFISGEEGEGDYWKSVKKFLARCRPMAMELPLKHSKLKYAGTADFIGSVDGELTLVDWKTADKEKREDWVTDYKLQCAAYVGCLRHELGIPVNRAIIVIAIPGREAQEIVLDATELARCWGLWQKRVKRSKAMRKRTQG